MIPIRPTDKITDSQSRTVSCRGMTSLIRPVPAITIIKVMTIIKKAKRIFQSKNFRIIPETIGPQARADPITRPAIPMVVPRLSLGVISKSTDWYDGKRTPTAKASSARPTIINQKPLLPQLAGVRTIISEPTSNSPKATTNIVLKFKLFSIQGLIGMLTHITSMKPVVSHWTVSAEMPNARISVGYAVDSDD